MTSFRAELLSVPAAERDSWLDRRLGVDVPADAALPQGAVPYLPSSVAELLAVVDEAPIHADDHVVDLGAGVGRAAVLLHLLTGARVTGVEIQAHLVERARSLTSAVSFIQGDATELVPDATVYFLYAPFNGEMLARAQRRLVGRRVCALGFELPDRTPRRSSIPSLTFYDP